MFKWLLRKLIGDAKKEIKKTVLESSTTRTVATASATGIAICRAIVYALAELGLIPDGIKEETAMVLYMVVIPILSRLFAILRTKL